MSNICTIQFLLHSESAIWNVVLRQMIIIHLHYSHIRNFNSYLKVENHYHSHPKITYQWSNSSNYQTELTFVLVGCVIILNTAVYSFYNVSFHLHHHSTSVGRYRRGCGCTCCRCFGFTEVFPIKFLSHGFACIWSCR